MRSKWVRNGILLGLVLGVAVFGSFLALASSRSGGYRLGEPVVFLIEDQKTSGWCCCCCSCPDTQILGWRVVDACGSTVYSLEFDPVGYASDWDGTWSQTDYSSASVPAGTYTLYVETSVGVLSHSFRIHDPCSRCCGWNGGWGFSRCWGWRCGSCGQVATITHGCCRTSLVLIQAETSCCSFRLCSPCCP